MTREYTIKEIHGYKVISYEAGGFLYSFGEDPANPDYQQYLRWLEDPNADEFQPPLEG